MPKALLIQPNGEVLRKDVNCLADLQLLCGGFVQCVPFTDRADIYMDEEGKCKEPMARPNFLATDWCTAMNVGLMPGDVIIGNAVVMGACDDDGNWTDVPDDLVDQISKPESDE